MYKTVVEFYDLTDGDHKYGVGDEFPRPGFSVSEERLAVLSGTGNKLGKPVIEKVSSKNTDEEISAKSTEEVSHETKLVVSRDEVNAMQYFKIKSVAEANGIDTEGKKTVELREAVIEKLGL